jgi:hypothetical protein
VDLIEALQGVPEQHVHAVVAGQVVAEQVFELAEADDERRGRGEAADDGLGEEVDEEARPSEAEAELDGTDQQREQGGEREVVAVPPVAMAPTVVATSRESIATGPTASWGAVPKSA